MLAAAKIMAEVFERLKQPAVVGEILAGIVIGPSLLGWVAPSELITILAEIGVIFLLFTVGLETKPQAIFQVGKRAVTVGVAGVLLPFAAGYLIAMWWDGSFVEAMFIGAALVATSVGITARVLGSIVSNDRLQRMIEMEAMAKSKSEIYPVAEMLSDLRAGLWKETRSGESIDAFRRRLQRVYLEAMASKINPPPAPAAAPQQGGGGRGAQAPVGTADFRPILKSEMRALDADLASAIGRTSDRMTKAHLEDARDQIKKMLETDAKE